MPPFMALTNSYAVETKVPAVSKKNRRLKVWRVFPRVAARFFRTWCVRASSRLTFGEVRCIIDKVDAPVAQVDRA